MKEIFTFYKAVDPVKGSWDGYGYFAIGDHDFLTFVTDAPSGASIHTPEYIKQFWQEFASNLKSSGLDSIELADALNRLQNQLQERGRHDNILYQATLVIVRKLGSKLFYCSIGDSALQIFRGEKLYRLSESEVWDGSLIAQSNQPARERQKTRENRFIGSNGSFIQTDEIASVDLKDQDVLVLYTDGVEDLMPPDQMLKILTGSQDLRKHMEEIFLPERVKDDATLIAIPIRISPAVQIEKEIIYVRNQIEHLKKEQADLRKHLIDSAAIRNRLDKIESTLHQVSQNVQRGSKRQETAGRGVSVRKQPPIPWMIAVLCLLLGTAFGALLFKGGKAKPVERPTQTEVAPKRQVAPPEIPPEEDCSYTVQKGDSLDKIAASRAISMDQLLKLNPSHKRDSALKIGQTLVVCKGDNP